MSFESAKAQLARHNLSDKIRICEDPTPTVETAAHALGCAPGNIAKTLAFLVDGMIAHEAVEDYTGHPMGGVCPFGVKEGCRVYLDQSLKRYEKILPACGTAHSAVDLTLKELEESAEAVGWVDVSKDPVPVAG